jgi:hypothetical protein
MIYSVIISCFCISWTLKLIFAAFIKDAYILKLIADPHNLTGDQITSNISFAIFVLIAIKVRIFYV